MTKNFRILIPQNTYQRADAYLKKVQTGEILAGGLLRQRLLKVDVVKHVFTQGRRQGLHPTRVHVELVCTHPVRDVVSGCYRIWPSNRYVVTHDLEAPDVRRAKVLHGING